MFSSTQAVRTTRNQAREFVLDLARAHPLTFFPMVSLKRKYDSTTVSSDTEIVIEGYPRCANTYAVAAFLYAQDRPVRVARHTHAIAQLKRAFARRLPVMLLIRAPEPAILSYVIREERVDLRIALRRYRSYYSYVYGNLDRCVVCPFDLVTQDFGRCIEQVNKRFGTTFLPYKRSDQAQLEVFRAVDEMERIFAGGEISERKVARPSEVRSNLQSELRDTLYLNFSDDLRSLESLHARILAASPSDA